MSSEEDFVLRAGGRNKPWTLARFRMRAPELLLLCLLNPLKPTTEGQVPPSKSVMHYDNCFFFDVLTNPISHIALEGHLSRFHQNNIIVLLVVRKYSGLDIEGT